MKNIVVNMLTASTLIYSLSIYAGGEQVPFPEDYRQWKHVKTMLIEPDHSLANPFQGIHHVYANSKAEKGFETGSYPDGSVIVFDLLNYQNQDSTITEAERKFIGVMHKNSTAYKSTGGWGFEGFSGDSKDKRMVSDNGTSCFACHQSQKDHGYVFSGIRK